MSDLTIALGVVPGKLRSSIATSTVVHGPRPVLVVRLSVGGEFGVGECPALPGAVPSIADLDVTRTVLEGPGARRLADAVAARGGALPPWGTVGALFGGDLVARAVASTFEMAVLDLELRERGGTLASLLGVARREVPVGALVPSDDGEDPTAVAERALALAAAGCTRLRFKIWPGHDVEVARAIRDACPTVALSADANGVYQLGGGGLDDARGLVALDDLRLSSLEQPLGATNLVDHARLRELLATPIVLDESVGGVAQLTSIIRYGAADGVIIKPGRLGGVAATRQALAMAGAAGLVAGIGGTFETGYARRVLACLAGDPAATLVSDLSAPSSYSDLPDLGYPVVHQGYLTLHEEVGIAGEWGAQLWSMARDVQVVVGDHGRPR